MAIAAVRDLDDKSLHTWQQELGLRRSEIVIDEKKTLITKDVTTHIILTVIKSLFGKFLGIRKTGEFVPRADGWCSDSDNEIDFRFPFARRVGEADLNNALYPNHVMKCIHLVHRHKRCY